MNSSTKWWCPQVGNWKSSMPLCLVVPSLNSIHFTPLCLFLLACNEADEMWQHKKAKRIITFESLNGIWGRKQTHHFPYIPIEHFVLGTSSNWGPCCFSDFLPSLGSMLTWAHSLCLLSIYLLFSQIIPSTTSQ